MESTAGDDLTIHLINRLRRSSRVRGARCNGNTLETIWLSLSHALREIAHALLGIAVSLSETVRRFAYAARLRAQLARAFGALSPLAGFGEPITLCSERGPAC